MKVLMKREKLPIVRPFDEVVIEVLQSPKAVEREIALKDGTIKKIEDYSIIVKPLSGKFESVTEKVVTKTEDGDEVVKPKKYDANELGEKAIMKLTGRAYEVLYDAWESKQITEGTRLKIRVSKKQNKTFYDEILVLDGEDEETEEEETEEGKEAKKAKPKLKG
jgi:hypothetical protein